MKEAIAGVEALMKARNLLGSVTPERRDCGRLCRQACCRADEDGLGGMLLYPGEESFYQRLPGGFHIRPDDSVMKGAFLLTCEGFCGRDDRPLACRIFPLTFDMLYNEACVSPDPRAWPFCPLMPSGMEGLSENFVSQARQAAEILRDSPKIQAFIKAQQAYVSRYTRVPWEEGFL
jgi:hypothetical protein